MSALAVFMGVAVEGGRRNRAAIKENLELADAWKARCPDHDLATRHEARAREIADEYLTSAPPAPVGHRRASAALACLVTTGAALLYRNELGIGQGPRIDAFIGGLMLGGCFLLTRAGFLDALRALAERRGRRRAPQVESE